MDNTRPARVTYRRPVQYARTQTVTVVGRAVWDGGGYRLLFWGARPNRYLELPREWIDRVEFLDAATIHRADCRTFDDRFEGVYPFGERMTPAELRDALQEADDVTGEPSWFCNVCLPDGEPPLDQVLPLRSGAMDDAVYVMEGRNISDDHARPRRWWLRWLPRPHIVDGAAR